MRKVLQVNRESILEDQIIWQGAPCFLPFLLLHSDIAEMIPITAFIWHRFYRFIPLVAYACAAFFCICVLAGCIGCVLTRYYITRDELIVKKGQNCYRIQHSDLLEEDYCLFSKKFERIFGCRSIRYGCRRSDPARGSSMSLWKKGAIFLCLRDYSTPDRMIQEILRKNQS